MISDFSRDPESLLKKIGELQRALLQMYRADLSKPLEAEPGIGLLPLLSDSLRGALDASISNVRQLGEDLLKAREQQAATADRTGELAESHHRMGQRLVALIEQQAPVPTRLDSLFEMQALLPARLDALFELQAPLSARLDAVFEQQAPLSGRLESLSVQLSTLSELPHLSERIIATELSGKVLQAASDRMLAELVRVQVVLAETGEFTQEQFETFRAKIGEVLGLLSKIIETQPEVGAAIGEAVELMKAARSRDEDLISAMGVERAAVSRVLDALQASIDAANGGISDVKNELEMHAQHTEQRLARHDQALSSVTERIVKELDAHVQALLGRLNASESLQQANRKEITLTAQNERTLLLSELTRRLERIDATGEGIQMSMMAVRDELGLAQQVGHLQSELKALQDDRGRLAQMADSKQAAIESLEEQLARLEASMRDAESSQRLADAAWSAALAEMKSEKDLLAQTITAERNQSQQRSDEMRRLVDTTRRYELLVGQMRAELRETYSALRESEDSRAAELAVLRQSFGKMYRAAGEVAFDVRQAGAAAGWHEPEPTGRWTGPITESTLDLPHPGAGTHVVSIDVLDAIEKEIVQSTVLSVNGEELLTRVDGNDFPCRLLARVHFLQDDTATFRLTLSTPRTSHPADFGLKDSRNLGLRIGILKISPDGDVDA